MNAGKKELKKKNIFFKKTRKIPNMLRLSIFLIVKLIAKKNQKGNK